jgi:amino acid transporter
MQKFQKKQRVLKFLTWIEIVSLFIMSFCIFWLRNVLVGGYYLILVFSIILWLVLFVMTKIVDERITYQENI